jgi:hypothetical protein
MLSVSIANQQEALELDFARIKAVARAVLAGEGMSPMANSPSPA